MADWWTLDDPGRMLLELRRELKQRKLRLFGCACCRATGVLGYAPACRAVVEVAERFADGRASAAELADARRAARTGPAGTALSWLVEAVICLAGNQFQEAIDHAARSARDAACLRDWSAARRHQADLLRDLAHVPEPLPVIERGWLAWNNGAVGHLARAIYQENAFAEMGVLADALEEAGCADAAILGHCRAAKAHARGCWVLDLILSKDR
jgi:hypothetical protein